MLCLQNEQIGGNMHDIDAKRSSYDGFFCSSAVLTTYARGVILVILATFIVFGL